jgi:Flp pilus assembly protein TadG
MRRRSARDDRGAVTAELAASLPVLVLVLAVALTAVGAAAARVRLQDAAREAARVAARGDEAAAQQLAARVAPGARLQLERTGDEVVATMHATVHPLTGLLPGFAITETAVAAIEPTAVPP